MKLLGRILLFIVIYIILIVSFSPTGAVPEMKVTITNIKENVQCDLVNAVSSSDEEFKALAETLQPANFCVVENNQCRYHQRLSNNSDRLYLKNSANEIILTPSISYMNRYNHIVIDGATGEITYNRFQTRLYFMLLLILLTIGELLFYAYKTKEKLHLLDMICYGIFFLILIRILLIGENIKNILLLLLPAIGYGLQTQRNFKYTGSVIFVQILYTSMILLLT